MTTILQIGPDLGAQQLVEEALGKNHHLIAVQDGPTAVQYCAMIQPDLILIDVELPHTDVFELVPRLKMFMPQTPMIVFGGAHHHQRIVNLEADGFLTKPLDPTRLIEIVESLLPPPAFAATVSRPAVEQFESQIAALNQANQRLASLNTISALIGTSLDLDHLMDEILHQIEKTIHFDSATLFLLKGDILEAAASRGLLEYRQGLNTYRKSDRNSAWLVVKNKLPLIINDVTRSDFWEPRPELGQVRAWLGVPLIYKDRVVGVLTLDKNEPNTFSDTDARYVFTLAFQTAIAVENAQLFDKLEKTVFARTQRLEAFKKVSQVISQGLSVDELLRFVGQGINQIFTSDQQPPDTIQVLMGLINGSYITVKLIYDGERNQENGQLNSSRSGPEQSYKLNASSVMSQVVSQSRSVILTDVYWDAVFRDQGQPAGERVRAVMLAPLITAGKTIGVIIVKQTASGFFDEDDLETLESVAFQVASAIEYARLIRKTRELAIVNERTRLAREMHDGVAQNLAYLLIQVDRGLNMVEEGTRVARQLELIGKLLEQNIDELRRNIFDLRPVALEGKSLFEALEKFVLEFGRRWNLQTSCVVQGYAENIPPEVESSLYRILQEALSNARQHAQCRQVAVKLTVNKGEWLELYIEDDGQGFNPDSLQQLSPVRGNGLGLTSMRERAESVGGQLTIDSRTGQGTTILARLPLQIIMI